MADKQLTANTSEPYLQIRRNQGWNRPVDREIEFAKHLAAMRAISREAVLKIIEKLEQL